MWVLVIEEFDFLDDLSVSVTDNLSSQRSRDFTEQLLLIEQGQVLVVIVLQESLDLVLHILRKLGPLGELSEDVKLLL